MSTAKVNPLSVGMDPATQEALKKLAFQMDDATTAIEIRINSINDVDILLWQLREDMDTAALNGNGRFHLAEAHLQVRILSELLHYLMKDLADAHKRNSDLAKSLFELVHGGQDL